MPRHSYYVKHRTELLRKAKEERRKKRLEKLERLLKLQHEGDNLLEKLVIRADENEDSQAVEGANPW
jgi:hypothetical protein